MTWNVCKHLCSYNYPTVFLFENKNNCRYYLTWVISGYLSNYPSSVFIRNYLKRCTHLNNELVEWIESQVDRTVLWAFAYRRRRVELLYERATCIAWIVMNCIRNFSEMKYASNHNGKSRNWFRRWYVSSVFIFKVKLIFGTSSKTIKIIWILLFAVMPERHRSVPFNSRFISSISALQFHTQWRNKKEVPANDKSQKQWIILIWSKTIAIPFIHSSSGSSFCG